MNRDCETAFFAGLLVGEGHFGGDGRKPHITLRMHVRHKVLFDWITRAFPGGRLYGPYHHGGRSYYQWMARGAYLAQILLPILDRHLGPELDAHSYQRYMTMKTTYREFLGRLGYEVTEAPGAADTGEANPAG
jgi:hypothetical protein